jgi:hypothetical protein
MKLSSIEKVLTSIGIWGSFLTVLLTTGCAARSAYMIPSDFEIAKKYPYKVAVNQSIGGQETHPLWTSQISDTEFTQALSSSLANSGLFRAVTDKQHADYILYVNILDYDKPLLGLDFDIRMKTQWQLVQAKSALPVWTEVFETTYRAKVTDALIAAERLQKANEGSARTNIREGIRRLSMATF